MKITIVGGGMVGLAQAIALSQLSDPVLDQQPVEVTVIEAREPQLTWQPTDYDARTCAINPETQLFLESLDTWAHIDPAAQAWVEQMQVWDANSDGKFNLDCAKLGRNRITTMIENRALVKALWQQAQAIENIQLCCPAKPDEQLFNADLVIGADGGHSWLREQLHLPFNEKDYEQQALVAVIETEKPHQNTAYQVFHHAGPLAVLPLQHPHHATIVWSNDLPRAQELMALPEKLFNLELTNAFDSCLGLLKTLTQPKAIPLVMRNVTQYIKGNAVLIGDAAHSIHPLAGQGVNLGLMDVQCLTQKISLALQDNKLHKHLREFERERKFHNRNIMHAMSLIKALFGTDQAVLATLRSMLLNQAHFINKVF